MAMTLNQISQTCLSYFDLQFVAEASAAQKLAVATAISGALQELWQDGPAYFKRREKTAILYGPTQVSLTATANSTAVTGFTGWQDWMAGCSMRVDGDQFDHEIVDENTLLQPYHGSSGTKNAQVFGDCVNMATEVSSVLGAVRLADIRELVPAPDRTAFNRANYWYEGDYGEAILSVQARRRWTGQPHTYWIDTVFSGTGTATSQPIIRLRVAPLPQQQYILKFDTEINPPAVTPDNLDSNDIIFELPGSNTELILLPFVLQRLTSCAWWKNRDALPEIARQFKAAHAAVYGSRPQVKRARRMVPRI